MQTLQQLAQAAKARLPHYYDVVYLTTSIHVVTGPLGVTTFLNNKPFSWVPPASSQVKGEKPMLYTSVKQTGSLSFAKGKCVTIAEVNAAVAALLN